MFQFYQTGGTQLRSVFQNLVGFGFQDLILPALLIFAIIFGILQTTKIFKTKIKVGEGAAATVKEVADRKINSIISIAIALLVVLPHAAGLYPVGRDPIVLIQSFLPATAVMLGVVLAVVLLLGLAGGGVAASSALQLLIAAIAAGVLIFVFMLNIFPNFFPMFQFLRDPSVQALLIVFLTMGLIGYWVMKPEGTEKASVSVKKWVGEKV